MPTSSGEFVSALGSATLDQRAALPSAHAAAKAVLALSAAIVRLVCTLHDEVSLVGGVA